MVSSASMLGEQSLPSAFYFHHGLSVLLLVRRGWWSWPWMGEGNPLLSKLTPWALFCLKTFKLPANSYQIQSGVNSTGKKI